MYLASEMIFPNSYSLDSKKFDHLFSEQTISTASFSKSSCSSSSIIFNLLSIKKFAKLWMVLKCGFETESPTDKEYRLSISFAECFVKVIHKIEDGFTPDSTRDFMREFIL